MCCRNYIAAFRFMEPCVGVQLLYEDPHKLERNLSESEDMHWIHVSSVMPIRLIGINNCEDIGH